MWNSDIGRKKKGATHKLTSDFDTYDFFSYYRKRGGRLTRVQFNYIIDTMHKFYAEELSRGIDVKLPCGLGKLRLLKEMSGMFFKDGKLSNNYPIDWGETKKLWKEDSGAYEQKKIIKLRRDYRYLIKWDKRNTTFKNKTIYRFLPVRSLKLKAGENMNNRMGDAILEKRNKYIL